MKVALACLWEATARKVGNVHPTASFGEMTYLDFTRSAWALEHAWSQPDYAPTLGQRILDGIAVTRKVVNINTNLGIVLLLAPLMECSPISPKSVLKPTSARSDYTIEDTCDVYKAIRLAVPGGLGKVSEEDVQSEPTLPLREAMSLAADRDRIAKQYTTDFADVFDFGVPALLDAVERFGILEPAIIECQLRWLAEFPDSLIARKCGPVRASEVQSMARRVLDLGGLASREGRRACVELDRHLRSDGHRLNPGTTADLVTACLFVALRENKLREEVPFRWNVSDWL